MKTNCVFKNDTQFFELKIKINNHVVAVFNLDTRNRELLLSISYLFHIVTFSGIIGKENEKHFIWVSMNSARKYQLGTLFLRLQLETGQSFYVVIPATRRSSRLQCKGSTFISQLF